MRVEWHGQSAFTLTADGTKVFIDPFGDMSGLAREHPGMKFDYPPIQADGVDLLLITHEHVDHNGTDGIAGDPTVLRSTAGTLESPIGEVIAISSEHDDVAGTSRGPNTIFLFDLDEIRVAHFGDFGQSRAARRAGRRPGGRRAPLPADRRRTDHRGRGGGRHRRAAPAALGGPDALPHAADQLPRDRGGVHRPDAARREALPGRLRHLGAARGGWRARRRPGVALERARYGRRSVASFAASASRSTILANSWKPSSVLPYCPEA